MISPTAKMHFKLVLVMAFLSAVGMLELWLRLSSTEGWVWLGTYSLGSFIVSTIPGLYASKKVGTEIMDLAERLVVTTNVLYIFVLALNVFLINT